MLGNRAKMVTAAAAVALSFGLWGCAGGAGEPSGQLASAASSEGSAVAQPQGQQGQQGQQKQQEPADSDVIYPWVVAKATHASASGWVGEYAYGYDDAGRLASITGLQDEVVGFNEFGTVKVSLSYDGEGRLVGIAPGSYISGDVAIEYDADGRASLVTREWTEPGRMPDAGEHSVVVEFAYGDDGELASSKSTATYVEAGTSETETREYSREADAGYEGKAVSDVAQSSIYTPPLVEWNDSQIMAGNGMGTGAIGEFDAHGNLVKVTTGDETVVTYEYQQIEADPATWRPDALSNPTLRTFAWDGLIKVNYLTFFPPQLANADAARVLEADTIGQEPATPQEAGTSPGGATAAGETIDTPGYTVSIPAGLSDSFDYTMEEGTRKTPTGFAYHAVVTLGVDHFEVACISNDWGVQGRYTTVNLGESSAMPGWSVWLYAPVGTSDPEAFRDLVTVK